TNLGDRQVDAQLRRDATAQMGDGRRRRGSAARGLGRRPPDFNKDDFGVRQDVIPRRTPYGSGLWCIFHVCLSGWPRVRTMFRLPSRYPPVAHLEHVQSIDWVTSRLLGKVSSGLDGAFFIIPSSPEQQDVRVLNVVNDGVYEGPSGSTIRAHGNSTLLFSRISHGTPRDALIRPGMTFEICALQRKHPLYCDISTEDRPQWPTSRLYTFFEAMAVRNAVRGVSNILKWPFARALHIGSTPYNYVVSPALGYSPRHERPAPVIPASPGLAILHRARQPPASPYTLVPRVFASQPPPYSPCDPNSPSRPPGRINFYPPPLTDGELQWHLWDAPPAVVDDTLLADTSIAYFPIHTLTIYIPQLADWQWHAWGPLVVRRPDGQYLRIANVLGAIYEYLHAPLTVADVAELRIARRTPNVGGKWARDAGESWSWEAEVMQFMLNRVESAGPEQVGVVPRRVDMLAGKLWFDKLVQALGHGQHAEMSLTFNDG
ncbi:hypothetical protein EV714DRAFT_210215, partial [Schizophyllum commune]